MKLKIQNLISHKRKPNVKNILKSVKKILTEYFMKGNSQIYIIFIKSILLLKEIFMFFWQV